MAQSQLNTIRLIDKLHCEKNGQFSLYVASITELHARLQKVKFFNKNKT